VGVPLSNVEKHRLVGARGSQSRDVCAIASMTAFRESTQQAPSRAWMNHGRVRPEDRVAVVNPLLRLQQSVGNQAVGRVIQARKGRRLQRQLGSASVAQTVLRFGASGPMVAELQRRLNQAGADPILEVDGVFGGQTRGAVECMTSGNFNCLCKSPD